MRVLYDLQASQPLSGHVHGGGTHALAVLEGLVQEIRHESIAAFYDSRRPLDPAAMDALRAVDAPLHDVRSDEELQRLLDSREFDRFYSSLPYDLYRYDLRNVDLVMTIHGLRAIEVPADRYEFLYARGIKPRMKSLARRLATPLYVRRHERRFARLLRADTRTTTIVVPSLHTKHALLGHFPHLSAEALHVVYSPLRDDGSPDEGAVSPPEPNLVEFGVSDRGYFLLVNAGRWIKNAYRAILALDRFFDTHPQSDLRVVALGVKPDAPLRSSTRHPERFDFHDYVHDDTLRGLYARAFALLYPTLNEGFGYPPLEAMRWGTPVICSAVASIPEVCDRAALYVNPTSVDELQNRISQLAFESDVWERCSRRGPERHREVEAQQKEDLKRLCRLILGSEAGSRTD